MQKRDITIPATTTYKNAAQRNKNLIEQILKLHRQKSHCWINPFNLRHHTHTSSCPRDQDSRLLLQECSSHCDCLLCPCSLINKHIVKTSHRSHARRGHSCILMTSHDFGSNASVHNASMSWMCQKCIQKCKCMLQCIIFTQLAKSKLSNQCWCFQALHLSGLPPSKNFQSYFLPWPLQYGVKIQFSVVLWKKCWILLSTCWQPNLIYFWGIWDESHRLFDMEWNSFLTLL